MDCHLFANPLPGPFFTSLAVGLLVVVALIITFLRRPAQSRGRRCIVLAVVALFCGPLLGITLGVLGLIFGDVHPMDRIWCILGFAIFGTICGVIGAVIITLVAGIGGDGDKSPGD
jgi:hypothetical protein